MKTRDLCCLFLAAGLALAARSPGLTRKEEGVPRFADEPAAHALYDRMLETLRQARSLSYESAYRWKAGGHELGRCVYRLWVKKPGYARLDTSDEGKRVFFERYQQPGMSAVPLAYLIDREGKVAGTWYDPQIERGKQLLRQLGIE